MTLVKPRNSMPVELLHKLQSQKVQQRGTITIVLYQCIHYLHHTWNLIIFIFRGGGKYTNRFLNIFPIQKLTP